VNGARGKTKLLFFFHEYFFISNNLLVILSNAKDLCNLRAAKCCRQIA